MCLQRRAVLQPAGRGAEPGGEDRVSALRPGKHLVGDPRAAGTGSDIAPGND